MQSWSKQGNEVASMVLVREIERMFKRDGLYNSNVPWFGHFNEEEELLYIGCEKDVFPFTDLLLDSSQETVEEFKDDMKVVYMKIRMYMCVVDSILGIDTPDEIVFMNTKKDVSLDAFSTPLGKPYRDQLKACMLDMGLPNEDLCTLACLLG